MTLAELMDMTRALAGNPQVTDGALTQLLNTAQEDVSLTLKVPTQVVYFKEIASAAEFNWPADARDEGILKVYGLTLDDAGEITSSDMLAIYDFDTASALEPNWTTEPPAKTPRFIVWDPTAEIVTPVPVPPPDASNLQSFRIHYVIRPNKMDELTDEPFNGRLKSFHDILAYRAAWLLTRDQVMFMELQRRMREAHGASTMGLGVMKNLLFSTRTGR